MNHIPGDDGDEESDEVEAVYRAANDVSAGTES
jgi:hypothetical protein